MLPMLLARGNAKRIDGRVRRERVTAKKVAFATQNFAAGARNAAMGNVRAAIAFFLAIRQPMNAKTDALFAAFTRVAFAAQRFADKAANAAATHATAATIYGPFRMARFAKMVLL